MARKAKFTQWLPPTPATPEMRASVIALAESQGKSIADIMREAVSLFLIRTDSKAIKNVSSATVESEGQS